MTTLFHKVKVIELFHFSLVGFKRLNNAFFCIVNEYHDMRQLNRCATSYLYSRRYSLHNSGFGRSYGRLRAFAVVILFKVDSANDARSDLSVRLCSFNVYHSVLILFKNALADIAVHILMYVGYSFINVIVLQIDLRQDKVKCAFCTLCYLFHVSPILRLRGILVAGNYCPF